MFSRQASTLLKIDGTDRSQDLSKGVTYIRNMIQTVLDKRLGMWEKYCLHHCFAVPEGFSLPQSVAVGGQNMKFRKMNCNALQCLNELPGESSMSQDALYDPDLDTQLDSLRDKLTAAGKESAQLSGELHALEKKSSSSDHFAGLTSEALQLYEQNSVHDMFREMVKTASELHMKVNNLKARRVEDIGRMRTERISNPERDLCSMNHGKGLYNAKLEDLQEFLGLGIHTSTGKIYIADAYTGLLVVGPNGGLATQLATTANGVPFCFLDGLDVDQLIGDVYFTDAMKFSKQLLLVLVTKFIGKRVQRYWLKGLKANTAEVIATFNGRPANIKRTPSGGVFDGSQLRNTCSTSYGSCRNKIEFIWSCFGENVCYSPIQQYFDQSSSGIWLSSRQRTTLHSLTTAPPKSTSTKARLFFSTKPSNTCVPVSFHHKESQYRKQISVANLLQRSLSVLLSFKISQKSLVSLINDCPGVLDFEFLKKWETGVSKFWDLGFDGLGFSMGAVRRVLEGFPRVILMNEGGILMRIEFLCGVGISREGIDRILYFFPGILGFGVEDRLKPLLDEFRDWGFSEDVIRKEIVREPRFLSMELGEFSRCLELLRTLKCREVIKERIFSEGTFTAGFEVKRRVDCLCKHGLIRREAFKVLRMEPRVITYKIENIEEKIEFLVHRMKCNVCCLVEVPEFLGVNFQKQIVPRYNVIEYLRGKGGLASEVGLKGLINPSRLRFYNLYVKPYPECEKMFGRFLGGQVKSKHPAGLWKLFKPPSYSESKDDVKNMKSFVESLV
ncbi:hypothetical protein JRO89_XS13G0008000 [Xanthoceras sorbifolium]|uniref:Uncharacterized protein n=1 Tax=Xanthoceras sorbifolium TaxID=99658 RepID=A0ABQ8H5T3_9ROSI|nr:hypothetical protein JRO89_XS13G0008000 [Xanthoceras sorbifolium]